MEYRTLGTSGVSVSAYGLGTMTFGGSTAQDEAFAQLDAFVEAGGTLVDTADVYTGGASETIIGRWLAARPAEVTERVVLATKGRAATSPEPNGNGLSRRHLTRALEASLRRLGVEAVDLYQSHAWDPLTPVEETLAFFEDAVRAGKILYAGVSNHTGWQAHRAADLAGPRSRPVSHQIQYNLLTREVEWEIVPAARSAGQGLIVFSPLAGGTLTGKYRPGAAPAQDTRLADPLFGPLHGAALTQQRTWAVLEALEKIATERDVPPSRIALAWVAGRPQVSSVLLGARTLAQLAANLGATTLTLSPQEQELLDEASTPYADYPYGPMAQMLRAREAAGSAFLPPTD